MQYSNRYDKNLGIYKLVEPTVVVLGDNDRNNLNASAFSFVAKKSSAEVDPTISKCASPTKM